MNKEDITDALNELDDDILEKTETYRDRKNGNGSAKILKNRIGRILAAAAAIVLLTGGTILAVHLIRNGREDSPGVTVTAPESSSGEEETTGTEQSTTADAEKEEDVYSVVYDEGYRMFSRYESYQPGVNDIQIVLENTSDHTLTISNEVTLEIEVKEGPEGHPEYVTVPMGEHYRQAMEERGVDLDGSRQGTTVMEAGSSVLPVFWSAHFMTEEDGPLAEGNYRLKVVINGKEQYFPFKVSEDGWDGKPHSIKELSAMTAVRYKEKIYYRPSAAQDASLTYEEANVPALEYAGQAALTDTRERLVKDLDAYRIDSRWGVYYDAVNDRLLISSGTGDQPDEKTRFTVLKESVEVKETENWK